MTTFKRALVPEDRNGHRPAMYLERAAFGYALAAAAGGARNGPPTSQEAAAVVQERWGDGVTEKIILRAAASPATIAAPGWAGLLAQQVVSDFVTSLEPFSAGAKVLNAAPRIVFDRMSTLA